MSSPSPKSQPAPAHEPQAPEAEHVHGPHCAHDHDHHHHHHGPSAPFVRAHKKVGRNDPCPCGSRKKYKRCCLNAA